MKVSVPHSSLWILLPFPVSIVGSAFVDIFAANEVLWSVGFVVMSICHLRFVPLVKK